MTQTELEEVCVYGMDFIHNADKLIQWTQQLLPDHDLNTRLICAALDKYQENGELLDPILPQLVEGPLTRAFENIENMEFIHDIGLVFYTITKVRGFDVIRRLVPHEPHMLEPVFKALLRTDIECSEDWHARYMLYAWMNVLLLAPFPLESMDSGLYDRPLDHLILTHALNELGSVAAASEAASDMIGVFLNRTDCKRHVPAFLQTVLTELEDENVTMVKRIGLLRAVVAFLASGDRAEHLAMLGDLVAILRFTDKEDLDSRSTSFMLQTQLLAQHVGLTLLPLRRARWRYTKQSRSLVAGNPNEDVAMITNTQYLDLIEEHSAKTIKQKAEQSTVSPDEIINEDEDFAGCVDGALLEYVLRRCLEGLQSQDTQVRWIAARCVGLVTERLPLFLADEVIEYVLELFSPWVSDAGWHGACIAVAELAGRSLFLPERLSSALPHLFEALAYEYQRGHASVGAHVRDAGCYVVWAISRAYDNDILEGIAPEIAQHLLPTICFDKAINVRRAASAAFQEMVGRLGSFPNGIDILQLADYFSVGNIACAYLEVAPSITKFPQYTNQMVQFLVNRRILHWEKQLRLLSAEALRIFARQSPQIVHDLLLDAVLTRCTDEDVSVRHGALIGIAGLLLGLMEGNNVEVLTAEERELLIDIPLLLDKKQLFRGQHGDWIREVCALLIYALVTARLPLKKSHILGYMNICAYNVNHPYESVRCTSGLALQSLIARFGMRTDHPLFPAEVYETIVNRLVDSNYAAKRGAALMIRSLSPAMLSMDTEKFLSNVESAAHLHHDEALDDYETRVGIITSLPHIVTALKVGDALSEDIWNRLNAVLLSAFDDYAVVDQRDVGMYVRLAVLEIVDHFIRIGLSNNLPLDLNKYTNAIVKQAFEKIDKVRIAALDCLKSLVNNARVYEIEPVLLYTERSSSCLSCPLPDDFQHSLYDDPVPIPHLEEVTRIVSQSDQVAIATDTFKVLAPLIHLPGYRNSVLSGVIFAIGSRAKTVADAAIDCFVWAFKDEIETNALATEFVLRHALSHLHEQSISDRVLLPLIATLVRLLERAMLPMDDNLWVDILHELRGLLTGVKTPHRAMAFADLWRLLLPARQDISEIALKCLVQMLCYKYPKVRITISQALYLGLMTAPQIPYSDDETVMMTLISTDWSQRVAMLKPVRQTIFDLLHISPLPPREPHVSVPEPQPAIEEIVPSST